MCKYFKIAVIACPTEILATINKLLTIWLSAYFNIFSNIEAADLYSPPRLKILEIPLGELDLNKGSNTVMFKITGKNEQSSGLDFDIYRIVFERIN